MDTNTLIDALGGTTKVSELFGVLPSAVSNWRKDGYFPARLHLRVFRVAEERGIELPADFFDAPPVGEPDEAVA